MEPSNSILETTDSDSQITVSEPPDLGNWFGSYRYESPVMNSNSFRNEIDWRDSEREREKGKSFGFMETGSEFHQKQNLNGVEYRDGCLSKISGSFESSSSLSEPTDIKNWFSSYVYESPLLDTTYGFGKEHKCGKDECLDDSIKGENEEDLQNFIRKGSASKETVSEKEQSGGLANCDSSWRDTKQAPRPLESPSLLSEPIHIRNWFSSYVYESPSLDTADGFGDIVCRDGIDEKDEALVETSNREKGEGLGGFSKKENNSEEADVKKVQSEDIAKYNTYSRHSKQARQPASVDLITIIDEPLSGENDVRHRHKTVKKHGISQAQHDDTSSFNKGDSQYKVDQETIHRTGFKSSSNCRSLCNDDGKRPQNLSRSMGSALQESSEATLHAEDCLQLKSDSEFIQVNGALVRKSIHGSKERKDEEEVISEDGFITTRKRKFTAKNDENSSRGQPEISKGTVPLVVSKKKALADATNFHHSPAMMITGRWKCPQQRKPNLGPPLKQLGLENWFTKS